MVTAWITLLPAIVSGLTLIRRELSDPLAVCNDGSQAAYYHDKDIRAVRTRVAIMVSASSSCGSVEECERRCGEEPHLCSSPTQQVVEREGGVWSSQSSNPLSSHLRVLLPYCSSDMFSGSRAATGATGRLHFQGRAILAAVLADLEDLGASNASLVLVGQGGGARGVAGACDGLAMGRQGRLRCVLEGGELVPWWVQGEGKGCTLRQEQRREQEQELWGEECRGMSCVPLSQHWSSITAPLLVVGSQLDVAQYTSTSCPLSLERGDEALAWRGGVVALAEARLLQDHAKLSLFLPNCPSGRPLAGGGWNSSAPLVGGEGEAATLGEVLAGWLAGVYVQAMDKVAGENPTCATPPSSPLTSCVGGCGGVWRPSYSHTSYSLALAAPASLFPSHYTRSCTLDPYWPSCTATTQQTGHTSSHPAPGHSQPASGSPVVSVSSPVVASRRERLWNKLRVLQHLKVLYNKYKDSYANEYHGVQPHVVRPTVVEPTLVRPTVVRPNVVRPTVVRPTVVRPNVVRPTIVRPRVLRPRVVEPSLERPVLRAPARPVRPSLVADYDYSDYSDYADYSDYGDYNYYDYLGGRGTGGGGGCGGGCAGGCGSDCGLRPIGEGGCTGGCKGDLFARIVKAARGRRQQRRLGAQEKGREDKARRRGGVLKDLVRLLEEENLDYEDFGRLLAAREKRRN